MGIYYQAASSQYSDIINFGSYDEMSMMIWFKVRGTTSNSLILGNAPVTGGSWILNDQRVSPARQYIELRFWNTNGNNYAFNTSFGSVLENDIIFLFGVFKRNDSAEAYWAKYGTDLELQAISASQATADFPTASYSNSRICSNQIASNYTDAECWDIRIINRKMLLAEGNIIYNSMGNDGITGNVIRHIQSGGSDGDTIGADLSLQDYSGNGNNGTIRNQPTWAAHMERIGG